MTPNKTDRKLARTGPKQTLQGVVGDTDANDLDLFGYEVIYTTGEFRIDYDDFVDKADELGIADWMLPGKTMPHYAFGRAIDDLLEGREEIEWEGQTVQFDLRKNGSRYSYTLDASVYFPPEMTDSDTGMWKAVENSDGQQGLGVIEYENPDEGSPHIRFIDRVEDDMSLYPIWAAVRDDGLNGGLRQRMQALFETHQESLIGKDINNMTYYLVDAWTDSIRLRDACYFVPANHTYRFGGEEHPIDDLIDAFRNLYQWLNVQAIKPDHAQKTEMHVIEIMDTERQREMVEQKVEEQVQEVADDATQAAVDMMQDDDVMTDAVIEEVAGMLDDMKAMASEYDDLLDGGKKLDLKAEKAVRRAIDRGMGNLTSDEQDLAERVLEEVDAVPQKVEA